MTTRADLRAVLDVLAERTRQDAKWGEQNHPDGTGPDTYPLRDVREPNLDFRTGRELADAFTDATDRAAAAGRVTWRDIDAEETFEAYAEEPGSGDLVAEIVQGAAVKLGWLGAIRRRVAADPVRVYVSGPIASDPDARRHFADAAAQINARDGFEAINPFDVAPLAHPGQPCAPGYHPGDGEHEHTSSACYMRTDLLVLLTCDAIYLLRGWERSKGASVEHAVAMACGMKVLYQTDVAEAGDPV